MDKSAKLKELKDKEEKYQQKLEEKRLSIGEADGPTQSRFPTGRFELEQEIEGLDIILTGIRKEIRELEKQAS
jgi:hypothetical protein